MADGPYTPNRLLHTGNDGFSSLAGDFNNDGKADIVKFTADSPRKIVVALSADMTFEASMEWGAGFQYHWVPMVGDFNADRRADIAAFDRATGYVYVYLSTGSKFAPPVSWHSIFPVALKYRPLATLMGMAGMT